MWHDSHSRKLRAVGRRPESQHRTAPRADDGDYHHDDLVVRNEQSGRSHPPGPVLSTGPRLAALAFGPPAAPRQLRRARPLRPTAVVSFLVSNEALRWPIWPYSDLRLHARIRQICRESGDAGLRWPLPHTREVAGSNPAAPIRKVPGKECLSQKCSPGGRFLPACSRVRGWARGQSDTPSGEQIGGRSTLT